MRPKVALLVPPQPARSRDATVLFSKATVGESEAQLRSDRGHNLARVETETR